MHVPAYVCLLKDRRFCCKRLEARFNIRCSWLEAISLLCISADDDENTRRVTAIYS